MRLLGALLACLTACTPGGPAHSREAERRDSVRADALHHEAAARGAALMRQKDSVRAAAAAAIVDSLVRLEPDSDVVRAIARGDSRFLAFQEPEPTVPGVPTDFWAYPGAPALKYLVPPSAAVDRRGEATAALTAYMQAFNRTMAQHIGRMPGRARPTTWQLMPLPSGRTKWRSHYASRRDRYGRSAG